ncbi:MAG: sigma-70 family RNA polymerase sigma factor [Actinomycetota bacterium]|nr:sigma-70 family RNA polymerase sigma factor [Actinomycetota bacterium]
MTDLLSELVTPSDAELIARVRGGDGAAFGDLFSRHVDAANRLGRYLVRGPDADDLVSDAFTKLLQLLQGGGGPDVAFRAYLLTVVRRLHIDKVRSGARLHTADDMSLFDPGVPFTDTAVASFENGAAAKAFASLPERWQMVLWHLEVEGQKPAEIAPLLGMSANSVSALAYRAREGLRQAFLTMHLSDISADECRWVTEHLGAYVREGLSRRDNGKVSEHLDECRRCTAMHLELTEVNSNLSGIIAPLLLGTAAAGYCSATGGVGVTGLIAVLGRMRDVVGANAGATTAGAIAAGVATVAALGFVAPSQDGGSVASADEPLGAATRSVAPHAAPAPLPSVISAARELNSSIGASRLSDLAVQAKGGPVNLLRLVNQRDAGVLVALTPRGQADGGARVPAGSSDGAPQSLGADDLAADNADGGDHGPGGHAEDDGRHGDGPGDGGDGDPGDPSDGGDGDGVGGGDPGDPGDGDPGDPSDGDPGDPGDGGDGDGVGGGDPGDPGDGGDGGNSGNPGGGKGHTEHGNGNGNGHDKHHDSGETGDADPSSDNDE